MPRDIITDDVREFLKPLQGQEFTLTELRKELKIKQDDKAWDGIRTIIFYLAEKGEIKSSGKRGWYKVIKKVLPVPVFSVPRERRPPFDLKFPRDRDTDIEIPVAGKAVIREGDLILIAGVSNYGKTCLSMNFLGENILEHPVLLGNEFTINGKPTPRFLNRLYDMNWVQWVNGDNQDMFSLLPVEEDFAENAIEDKINIIDWIDVESGKHYLIGNILKGIKNAIGKGIAISVIQKSEYQEGGRGGQFTKDYTDLELLIDRHGNRESRLTVGKCKESTERLTGRSWAFGIVNHGVSIINVREVQKCFNCFGRGYTKGGECAGCAGIGWIDKKEEI